MGKPVQTFPDTYSVPVRIQAKRMNTNHRYRHFNQTHFTVGDEEQFEQQRHKSLCLPFKISSTSEEISVWNRYQVNPSAVQHTFQYIFHKFKKGIFIQIRNGRLVQFLPFSNAFYVNEWASRVELPPELQQQNILPKEQWYTNNGLFRYEAPINETDTGMCQMKHMFEQLCLQHSIPDLDFFVNRRDFPLLKTDLTEPYDNIWDSAHHPLVSHSYDTYAPLLSSCTREGFADIAIPTMDDWTRVCFKEGVHFAMTKRAIATRDIFNTPWHKKRELAVFRGSSTGIGHNANTNPRIRLCEQFQRHPYCNVGLTAWNTRYRKISGSSSLTLPKPTFPVSNSLSLEEQSLYKYIIHVEGHVQAYRLSIELAMGSVILLVESKYKLWYQDRLEPWVHYVPVQNDLSDLDERIQWCISHDTECQSIAKQAREFYDTYLTKEGCLTHLKNVLYKLSYRCVRKTNMAREIFTQKNIQQHYLKSVLTKQKSKYQVRGVNIADHVHRTTQLRRWTCFQNNNTTITVYDDVFVQKTSKYSHKFDHELFVGVFCVNRILRCIPNFTYTVPIRKTPTNIYVEYIPGLTLFDYIKSASFNLNEWLFYMIQTLLAVSVAQRMCFFTHHDLCPWNIILSPCSREQVVDYVLGIDQIFRVYTTCIPVIIDYDKTHVVYDLQSFKHFFGFQPFQDALCLFISSVYNIIRYQKLNNIDQKKLLFLFNQIIQDPVYCPNVKTFDEMEQFLNEAHKYAHISFSNKGNLTKKTLASTIRLLISQYRPGYSSQSKIRVVNTIEETSFALYTNAYRWESLTLNLGHCIHPMLKLYTQQLAELSSANTQQLQALEFEDPERLSIESIRIRLPVFQDHFDQWSSIPVYPAKYLEFLNMFVEVACHGGTYRLLDDERKQLILVLQNYLNTMDRIYSYSKVLINFKLSRNIL